MARTLQERLDSMREAGKAKADPAVAKIMHDATARLIASGAADRALGEGDTAPAFALPDAEGEIVRSQDLLSRGPLVLTFFRGHW